MADFPIPSILDEQTVENIHARMLETIPDDLDKSQGQFPWDYTRPSATELSYFIQCLLVEAIKTVLPRYSYGEYLDELAKGDGLTRKAATFAVGVITVSGSEGTVIPLGSIFSTENSVEGTSIDFATTEEATIPAEGSVDIPIICTEAGADGNVPVGTITLKSSELSSDITSVTNGSATEGGTDEETDDALRERIEDVEQSKGVSYVGSKADYKRWAESVEGVGDALVIPAQNDSGLVTIILTDANGNPASEKLCTAVYDYIMGTKEDQSDRQVNVNASLLVKAPELVSVSVTATIETDGSVTIEELEATFLKSLNTYLLEASGEGVVKYSRVCSVLLSVPGITDYSSIKVNGTTANITIETDEIAVATADDITLTEGA